MKVVNVMPNFDGTGPRGGGRRAGSGRGICRRSSEGRSGQVSGRQGIRLSDLFWLAREVLSIWGAFKALRGSSSGPSLSVTEHDPLEREKSEGFKNRLAGKIKVKFSTCSHHPVSSNIAGRAIGEIESRRTVPPRDSWGKGF